MNTVGVQYVREKKGVSRNFSSISFNVYLPSSYLCHVLWKEEGGEEGREEGRKTQGQMWAQYLGGGGVWLN